MSTEIIDLKPDLIVNISSSPYHKNRKNIRRKLILDKFANANCPFIYCNIVGGQDELIFDGNSLILNSNMELVKEGESFQEDLIVANLNSSSIDQKEEDPNKEIYNALTLGIKDYFSKTDHQKAVIGLSGGIDSALVLSLIHI